MGIPFHKIGKGNVFSLERARAMRTAAEDLPPLPELPLVKLNADQSRALTPWHTVPGFGGRSAIYDAENHLVSVMRSDIASRVVEAMNEVEGRIPA